MTKEYRGSLLSQKILGIEDAEKTELEEEMAGLQQEGLVSFPSRYFTLKAIKRGT